TVVVAADTVEEEVMVVVVMGLVTSAESLVIWRETVPKAAAAATEAAVGSEIRCFP
ncbi:unnamed protein product, partial [Brassica oleracea var. botrytis]